jgi:hypothetical protein
MHILFIFTRKILKYVPNFVTIFEDKILN